VVGVVKSGRWGWRADALSTSGVVVDGEKAKPSVLLLGGVRNRHPARTISHRNSAIKGATGESWFAWKMAVKAVDTTPIRQQFDRAKPPRPK